MDCFIFVVNDMAIITRKKLMIPTYISRLLFSVLALTIAGVAFSDVPLETGIIDAFRTLKAWSYFYCGVAALIGAMVYTYMHKRRLSFDRWAGLAVSLVLIMLLFEASSSKMLDDTAKVCWVITDANEPLMLPCAQGRESLANIFGVKSLYVTVFPRDILAQGIPEPIAPIAIKFMLYGSLLLSSLGLCLFFQWLSKNFLIK